LCICFSSLPVQCLAVGSIDAEAIPAMPLARTGRAGTGSQSALAEESATPV
jgi:hypothetical protein